MKKLFPFLLGVISTLIVVLIYFFFFSQASSQDLSLQEQTGNDVSATVPTTLTSSTSPANSSSTTTRVSSDSVSQVTTSTIKDPFQLNLVDYGIYLTYPSEWGDYHVDAFGFIRKGENSEMPDTCYITEPQSVGSCVLTFSKKPNVQLQITTNDVSLDNFFLHGDNGIGPDLTAWTPPNPQENDLTNFCNFFAKYWPSSLAAIAKDVIYCVPKGKLIEFERNYEENVAVGNEKFVVYGLVREIHSEQTPFRGLYLRLQAPTTAGISDIDKQTLYAIAESAFFVKPE